MTPSTPNNSRELLPHSPCGKREWRSNARIRDVLPSVWKGRPILFPEPTHGPFFCYSRQKITGSEHHPLSASLPAMSEAQAEALDLVHYVAEAQGLTLALHPGDILLNNNLSVMHGRRAFDDAPTNGQRRHIMRLWMRSDRQAWKTPPELEQEWHRVYGDSDRRSRACWKIRPQDTELDQVIGHKMTCG